METPQLPIEVVESVLSRMASENGALTMHLIAAQETIKRKDAQITQLRNQISDLMKDQAVLKNAVTSVPVTNSAE